MTPAPTAHRRPSAPAFQTSTGADWNGSIGGICECFLNFTEEEAARLNCWIGRFNVQETHAQCKVCTEVFDDLSTGSASRTRLVAASAKSSECRTTVTV